MASTPATWAGRVRALGANVVLLGVVSFLADVSGEMTFVLLPFLVLTVGGTGLAVGLVGGLGDGVAHLVKVLGGNLSDRVGRRKGLAFSGYAVGALGKVGIALAGSSAGVVLFRALERTGKGVRTAPRDALLAESAGPERRGAAFGLHRAMDTLGAVGGVALALVLVESVRLTYDQVILVAAVVGVLSLVPFVWVREHPPASTGGKRLLPALGELPSTYRRYLLVAGVFGLANVTLLFFILRAARGSLAPQDLVVPILLYLLYNVVYAGAAYPLGAWSDRVGRGPVLLLGFLLFAVASAGFALEASDAVLAVLFVLLGVAYAMVEGNHRALAVDLAGNAGRGTALGALQTLMGLTSVAGGIAAGLLWDAVSPAAAFAWAGALAFLALVLGLGLGMRGWGRPRPRNP